MKEDDVDRAYSARVLLLAILGVITALLLISRLYYVQVLDRGAYTKSMKDQIIRPKRIPPIRGRIETVDGVIVANNEQAFALDFYLPEYRQNGVSAYTVAAEKAGRVIEEMEWISGHDAIMNTRSIAIRLKARDKELQLPNANNSGGRWERKEEEYHKENQEKRSRKKESIYLYKNLLSGVSGQLRTMIALPPFMEWKGNDLICYLDKLEVYKGKGGYERTADFLVRKLDDLCDVLNRDHEVTSAQIVDHLKKKPALPFRGLEDLSLRERTLLSERQTEKYEVVLTPKRTYPHPYAFSHLVGYTGKKPLDKSDDRNEYSYYIQSLFGRSGVESRYDDVMAGKGGKKLVYVNRSGFEVKDEMAKQGFDDNLIAPENGNNVELTINAEAQKIAYDLMKDKKGAMAVVDIHTGAVIVLVSTPSYDLSRARFKSYSDEINKTRPGLMWFQQPRYMHNRAIQAFPPGSIVKTLVALLALEEGVIDVHSELECHGYQDKPVRCASRWGHGKISVEDALMVSCNPFFIDVARAVGTGKLTDFYRKLGLGTKPIYKENMVPSISWEQSGSLPRLTPADRRDKYFQIGIGQGEILVSPLQAACFIATVANKGKIIKPYIVSRITDSLKESVLFKAKPYDLGRLAIQPRHFETVHKGMYKVVHGPEASAPMARSNTGVTIGGKTGSAQNKYYKKDAEGKYLRDGNGERIPGNHLNCWFAGFVPFENPRYAAVVMVETEDERMSGGRAAAPVMRAFFDRWSETKQD